MYKKKHIYIYIYIYIYIHTHNRYICIYSERNCILSEKNIHAECLDDFTAADIQKVNTIQTANRRHREKGQHRVKQRLFKMQLREVPDDWKSVKKKKCPK